MNIWRYEVQNDLKLYTEREMESTFHEIIEPTDEKNKIIECICKHPNVPVIVHKLLYGSTSRKLSCKKKNNNSDE